MDDYTDDYTWDDFYHELFMGDANWQDPREDYYEG